jgi:CRISPR-associated helicase Cas3/CRISPR-associated endonuclease Cas3-HD
MTIYFAHSENEIGHRHTLREHLRCVAGLAHEFAATFPWNEEARLAGLIHDLGKYGDLFRNRLNGTESGLDHWSTGALVALLSYHSLAASLAIEGHHIGLQCANRDEVTARFGMTRRGASPLGHHIRLSDPDTTRLLERARSDDIVPQKPESVILPIASNAWVYAIARMLDVRMLFSCLVDADYLDTEAHFNGGPEGKRYRAAGTALNVEQAMQALERFMGTTIRGRKQSSDDVSAVRTELWEAVTQAAKKPNGLFSLTAPTGSGKTLAMLQFALTHARANNLSRIVLAVPYLSIIEQTARIYREVFSAESEHFVLEHHSLAGVRASGNEADKHDDAERQRRLLAENWDAPIIITTNVQLLESLFSNRPSSCRKLHRLHNAVILFDEAQSLPQHLALPTLAALSHLATDYRTSVVFATATQPAFDTLHEEVCKHAVSGWQPQEIVSSHPDMFRRLERVRANWPKKDEALNTEALATTLTSAEASQVLCVFNLKRHAHALLQAMDGVDGLFHLSTNLCTAHRRAVLDEVRVRLDPTNPQPCRLISTQCIEAGVDLDFPIVYRAMAPLEAIAQAAGRCNREGRLNKQGKLGQLRVFEPAMDAKDRRRMFPTFSYFQAAEVTASLLKMEGGNLDLNDPAIFRRYYEMLYDLSRPVEQNRDLTAAINALDFVEIANRYRLIEQDAIQVVVPWQPHIREYEQLRNQAAVGIDGKWMRSAQTLSVSVYRPKAGHPAWGCLIPARFRRGGDSDEWFVLEDPQRQFYHPTLGLRLPQNQTVMIA